MNETVDNQENNRNANTHDSKEGQNTDAASVNNVTSSKPDHSKARANVYVEGLSVFGFNPGANRAEFGFFKHMHHPVEMKIYNRDCQLIWASENNFPGSTLGMQIDINTTKTGTGSRYDDAADAESFGRMPDLAAWHGVRKLDPAPDPQNFHLSARLHLYDAVFYTHKMSVNNATRYEQRGSRLENPVPLGRIGRIPGADIFCPPTDDLEIEIKPKFVPSPVKIVLGNDDNPYKIIVRARPLNRHDHTSHLAHLYNVLKRPSGDQRTFAVKFDADEPPFLICDEVGLKATQFECQTFSGGCCW